MCDWKQDRPPDPIEGIPVMTEGGKVSEPNQAFESFFRAHYLHLVRLLAPIGGDVADAVQETFVQAYLDWHRVSTLDKPEAWVRLVAVRRLLDQHRRRRRSERIIPRLWDAGAGAAVDEPELVDLMRSITELPLRTRCALVLHYFEDMTVDEVAKAMGITSGAVKFHLSHGRRQLRKQLVEHR